MYICEGWDEALPKIPSYISLKIQADGVTTTYLVIVDKRLELDFEAAQKNDAIILLLGGNRDKYEVIKERRVLALAQNPSIDRSNQAFPSVHQF